MAFEYDEDEDLVIRSEIIWNFENIKKELLEQYPNGRGLVEQINTIDGQHTWRVEIYPNGKDRTSSGRLAVYVTLVNVKRGALTTPYADCNYYIQNHSQMRGKNYVGQIERRKFSSYVSEGDISFENGILTENDGKCTLVVNVTQYPYGDEVSDPTLQKFTLSQISSATPNYNNQSARSSNNPNNNNEDFDDFKIKRVNYLYGK